MGLALLRAGMCVSGVIGFFVGWLLAETLTLGVGLGSIDFWEWGHAQYLLEVLAEKLKVTGVN